MFILYVIFKLYLLLEGGSLVWDIEAWALWSNWPQTLSQTWIVPHFIYPHVKGFVGFSIFILLDMDFSHILLFSNDTLFIPYYPSQTSIYSACRELQKGILYCSLVCSYLLQPRFKVLYNIYNNVFAACFMLFLSIGMYIQIFPALYPSISSVNPPCLRLDALCQKLISDSQSKIIFLLRWSLCLSFKIFSVVKPPYLIFICGNKYNRVVVTKKQKANFELLNSTYD